MAAEIYPLLARDVFATFGYFAVDGETGRGFLVDPGAQPQLFLQAIHENGWEIEAILLTHGHFDHAGAANAIRDELGVPVMAHELADRYLLDPRLNLSAKHGRDVTVPHMPIALSRGFFQVLRGKGGPPRVATPGVGLIHLPEARH